MLSGHFDTLKPGLKSQSNERRGMLCSRLSYAHLTAQIPAVKEPPLFFFHFMFVNIVDSALLSATKCSNIQCSNLLKANLGVNKNAQVRSVAEHKS